MGNVEREVGDQLRVDVNLEVNLDGVLVFPGSARIFLLRGTTVLPSLIAGDCVAIQDAPFDKPILAFLFGRIRDGL